MILREPISLRTESTAADLAVRDAISDALDMLTEGERFAFNAHEIERLSYSQIACVLGKSKSTAERYRNQAIAQLRALLDEHPLVQERMAA